MIRPPLLLAAIALAACAEPTPFIDVRVDRDTGEGEEGSDARHASLCGAGASLYAAWADDRSGEPQIYFNRSEDGGRTWAEEDTRISVGAPSGTVSDVPSVSCEEGRVAIVWEDDRHSDLGDPTIYARTSADGGATWYPEQRVTRDAFGDWRSLEPQVLVRDTWIYVVWSDNRNGAYDIYFNVSDDVGATWLDNEVRIDTDEPGAAYSANARMAADEDGYVYVVWEDSRSVLNDIYMSRSYSNGLPNTWMPGDLRLDTGDAPGAANSYAPSISAGRGRVAVAWHDRRNGSEPDVRADIYAQVATDRHLLDFHPEAVRVESDEPGAGESVFPTIQILDTGIGVVWRDDRRGVFDILYARSEDAGATWSTEVQVDAFSDDNSDTPVFAFAGEGRMAVAWADLRNSPTDEPREDIYVSASRDGGRTWRGEWKVNDYPSGRVRAVFPSVALDGEHDEVQVLWEDWRDGNADVYFRASTMQGTLPEDWQ